MNVAKIIFIACIAPYTISIKNLNCFCMYTFDVLTVVAGLSPALISTLLFIA